MCGIAGIFLANTQETPSKVLLQNLIKTLKHRGPDVQQTFSTHGVGLAHARLSIIDLNEGANQPMLDIDTGNVIVFNGEIYNYIELKAELIAKGYHFYTNSDTEVILKAYACWGISCQNKFNGMWSFVLYDKKADLIFASRDRMGVKPFVFGITHKNDFVFASEAKAIVREFSEFNQANHSFLFNFVEYDFFACYKETFYKNIFNLLPGHYLLMKHGGTPDQKRYWSWTPSLDLNPANDHEVTNQFKELLIDSIKLRFRSDVPVGSCLSGGLDSSTIVGLATQLFDKQLHTFSCIYPNTPEFDESSYIRASVKKFNAIPSYIEPKHDDFLQLMHASIYEQDGPTGGPSILSQRAVMELASRDVRVVLDGQGADEVLGGYHSYFRYSLQTLARNLNEKKTLKNLYHYLYNASKIKKRANFKISRLPILLYLARSPVKFYTRNILETQLHYFKEYDQDDLNTLLLEHSFTNLCNLLHYEDRNSMRFSIESRLPYLDYRLIEFAFSLPHQYKIRGSTTKWLLNRVANDILPSEVFHRKDKMGFTTPAHKWFLENDNINFFRKYLHHDNAIYANLSESTRDYLTNSFNALHKTENHTPASSGNINALWRFFTANLWYEQVNNV